MSKAPTGSIEREIKLGARPGFALPDLTGVAPGVAVVAQPALDLDAMYVDTADLQLVRNGVSLRRRTGEGEPRWTFKLPSGRHGEALLRREIDVEDPGYAVPADLATLVTGWVRGSALVPVIGIRSHRARLRLVDDDGNPLAEIDDDSVAVVEMGQVAARFREVEVEMAEHGTPELLQVVSDALVAAGAGAPDPTSKVVRGLGPRALAPPDLTPPPVDEASPLLDVVTAAFRSSVGQIVDNDHVIRLDDDPEGVHQARVGARKLRSDLRLLGPVLADGIAEPLRARLHELGAALGVVRDTDVQIHRLTAAVESLPAVDRAPSALVLGRLAAARSAETAELLQALTGPTYVTLLDDLVALAVDPGPVDGGDRPAVEVLPRLVRPAWRRLRHAVEALDAEPTDEALHHVRALSKRARHASELAAAVVGDDAARLAARLADLQDVLGELNDAVVAESSLRRTATVVGRDEQFAIGELVVLVRADAANRRAAWYAAWVDCDQRALTRWLR